eukprot:UN25607
MKVVREAEEAETPGADIQDSSNVAREAEIASGDRWNSSHSQKEKQTDVVQQVSSSFCQQRKQPEPGEQPDLQTQIQCTQKIPQAYEQFSQINRPLQDEFQEQCPKPVQKQPQLENPLPEESTIQTLEVEEHSINQIQA